jgi:hypothetical protein
MPKYALPHNLFTCFIIHFWEKNVTFQRQKQRHELYIVGVGVCAVVSKERGKLPVCELQIIHTP